MSVVFVLRTPTASAAVLLASFIPGLRIPVRLLVVAARLFKSTPVGARVHVPGKLPVVSEAVQIAIYRLAQECCRNVVRHSGASRVKLSLASSDGWLELSVTDNGGGFDVETALRKPDSFGLAGMRERVVQMGGALEIQSRRGRGARVTARLPATTAGNA